MLRATIAVLAAVTICATADAASPTARFRPVTSLKVKPSTSVSSATRFKVNPILARPTLGGYRRPLNRSDPLNPQPLPPDPGRLKRADPLNPQPLPPGPPPQGKLVVPKVQPATQFRVR